MADYKKVTGKRESGKPAKKRERGHLNEKDRLVASVVLFAAGILMFFLAVVPGDKLWGLIRGGLFGLFGVCGFLAGVTLVYIAVRLGGDRPGLVRDRIFKTLLLLLFLCGLVQIFFVGGLPGENLAEHIGGLFAEGQLFRGGGLLGLVTAGPLLLFGRIGAKIVAVLLTFVVVMLAFNITLAQLVAFVKRPFLKFGAAVSEKREIARQIREEEAEYAARERLRRAEEFNAKNIETAAEFEKSRQLSLPRQAASIKSAEAIIEQRIETERFNKQINRIASETMSIPSPREELSKRKMFEAAESLQGSDYDDDDDDAVEIPPIGELKFADDTDGQAGETVNPIDLLPPQIAISAIAETANIAETAVSTATADIDTGAVKDFVPPWDEQTDTAEIKSAEPNVVIAALNEYEREQTVRAVSDTAREAEIARDIAAVVPDIAETAADTAESAVVVADKETELYISEPIPYSLPPSDLLDAPVLERSDEDVDAEIDANSDKLINTLKSFGVQAHMVGVSRGPSVTRYEIQPGLGVKISKITGLSDDIALNLAAAGVRIEAPIPGKSAVGVEVPNRIVESVPFRSLVESEEFVGTKSKLGAALGKAISGEIVICDVAKMPHLLIAGTTGSGKSVCVNSIIMSMLFRSTPDEVRFIMVDPKSVEFMIYNGIPHLLIPVVTDPKKASGALAWAVTEMTNRYKTFAAYNVRDLKGCNAALEMNGEKPLPQIVIFIDELADLMMAAPGEVESSICRLAQMARAAGMHLVIATQRPTVNVVTGLIKANIPSRIALKVASQIDSRTILDTAGADKLLGKGDMLFSSVSMPKPQRVQGCWVSDKEVERVVEFIKNTFSLEYDETVMEEIEKQAEQLTSGGGNGKKKGGDDGGGGSGNSRDDIDMSDDRLEEAIKAVIDVGQASTSYLQRKLGLGYGRAARLIDVMEKMGVVGAFDGKKRQVLMSRQEWLERFNSR